MRTRTYARSSPQVRTRPWGLSTATLEPEPTPFESRAPSHSRHDFAGIATASQRPVEISRTPARVQRQEDDKPETAPETAAAAPAPTEADHKLVNTAAPEAPKPIPTSTDAQGTTTIKDPPTIIYDEYSGATLQDVAAALPKESGSASFDIAATTEGEPITKSTIEVTQEVHLPQWKERDQQCAAVQKAWDDFANAMKVHEDGHVSINQSKFANAHRRYSGQPSSSTQKVTDKIKKEAKAAGDEYDDKTKHGLIGKPPTIIDLTASCAHAEAEVEEGETVQAKLDVSEPGDSYELEADRVADQVMRMADPYSTGWLSAGGGASALQRKCAECEEEDKKKNTEEEEDDEPLVDGEKKLQRSASGPGLAVPSQAMAIVRSAGQPLDADTRAFMEPRFGFDFSKVRIHADADAARAARTINARAYTLGADVAFARGQYSPRTSAGKRLLAHELAHVVQQSDGRGAAPLSTVRLRRFR